jgi:hypothetical protein
MFESCRGHQHLFTPTQNNLLFPVSGEGFRLLKICRTFERWPNIVIYSCVQIPISKTRIWISSLSFFDSKMKTNCARGGYSIMCYILFEEKSQFSQKKSPIFPVALCVHCKSIGDRKIRRCKKSKKRQGPTKKGQHLQGDHRGGSGSPSYCQVRVANHMVHPQSKCWQIKESELRGRP